MGAKPASAAVCFLEMVPTFHGKVVSSFFRMYGPPMVVKLFELMG